MSAKPLRKQYVSRKVHQQRFNEVAEAFTQRFGILIGAERCSGDIDTKGTYHPPAIMLHVNGLAFRVESLTHAVAFIQGVECGFDFKASSIGHGYVSRSEVSNMIADAIKRFIK